MAPDAPTTRPSQVRIDVKRAFLRSRNLQIIKGKGKTLSGNHPPHVQADKLAMTENLLQKKDSGSAADSYSRTISKLGVEELGYVKRETDGSLLLSLYFPYFRKVSSWR